MIALVDRIMVWALATCLTVMTGIVTVSVLFRYFLDTPIDWSGELASLLFAWLTFTGAYVGFRQRSYIVLDTLIVYLPTTMRRALQRAVDLACLGLLMIVVWQGIGLTQMAWSLEYPAMQVSRGYLYASLPVGGGLIAFAILSRWHEEGASRERS